MVETSASFYYVDPGRNRQGPYSEADIVAAHPAYASNVLVRFNLQPLASSGLSTGGAKK